MDIYIVRHEIYDCECHDTTDNYFTSLNEALDYAESHYTAKWDFEESVGIYLLYPEYNYLELIYSYNPPSINPYEDMEYEEEESEDWYLDQYYITLDEIAAEDARELELDTEEINEWMHKDYNLPWDYVTMANFLRYYNDWGWRFGHPVYQSSGHKFRAFKWHINNDRSSTQLLKALYLKLSREYGEAFVDSFIK